MGVNGEEKGAKISRLKALQIAYSRRSECLSTMEGCPWARYQVRCTRVIDLSGGILPTRTGAKALKSYFAFFGTTGSRALIQTEPIHEISSQRRFLRGITLFCFAFLAVSSVAQSAQTSAPVNETGKFRLHKFEQPIGEETYTITREGDKLTLTSDFLFNDRGTKVPLTATLRAAEDYAPQTFVIKGKTSR